MKQIKLISNDRIEQLERETNEYIKRFNFDGHEIIDIIFKNSKSIGYTMIINKTPSGVFYFVENFI